MDKSAKDSNHTKDVVKLKHPFQLNGQMISELALDFEALSAEQQFEAERLYKVIYADRQPEAIPRADTRFHLILAATAAGINPEEALTHVRGKDVQRLVNKALGFCGDAD